MVAAGSARNPAQEIFAGVKQVLDEQNWVRDAQVGWPTPIATELAQLLRMLEAGVDAGGLLMQVRDTAEVLLKTLTLIAARDLIEHGGPDGAMAARVVLFSGTLSLGSWRAGFAKFAAVPPGPLMLPELLTLAEDGKPFMEAIATYIEQRNRDIGHGAYRPDSAEIAEQVSLQLLGAYDQRRPLPDANRYTGGLDRAFAAVAASGVWRGCTLHADAPDGPSFLGADNTRGLRLHAQPGHEQAGRRLLLVRGGRFLDLGPFITGRLCSECGHRDAFLFDSPRSPKPRDNPKFDFLDYANGHRLRVDARKTDKHLADLADLHLPLADIVVGERTGGNGGEFTGRDVVRLLEDIIFDQRFLSPDWLRSPFQHHLEQRGKGIFWVQAPAHVGKTMFVRGLFGEGLGKTEMTAQRSLMGKAVRLDVVPVFLKREYRFGPARFASELESRVRASLRSDTALTVQLPRDGDPAALQAGFVRFLQDALAAAHMKQAGRLIVAVDGLDELHEEEGRHSALDYIPAASALPDNVTLLLTSRPPEDCPPWMRARLANGFAPGHHVHRVDVGDPDYLALLRGYVGRHSGVAPNDPEFGEVLKLILERSGSLFLFVSFLCDLIREGATTGDAVQVPTPA